MHARARAHAHTHTLNLDMLAHRMDTAMVSVAKVYDRCVDGPDLAVYGPNDTRIRQHLDGFVRVHEQFDDHPEPPATALL